MEQHELAALLKALRALEQAGHIDGGIIYHVENFPEIMAEKAQLILVEQFEAARIGAIRAEATKIKDRRLRRFFLEAKGLA